MEYRGLSAACCKMYGSMPDLRALLEVVCRDPDCCVEVRHNYLSCYYRGGSLFRMKFKPMVQKLEFSFDPKYFAVKRSPCAAQEALKVWIGSGPSDPREWLDRLGELKQTMDAWLSEHPKAERETQQELVKRNTFAWGSCQSMDIELAIPKDQRSGRMDIIAVRREGERYIPVIVELKHGTGAFDQKSGVRDHYLKTTRFLDREGGEPYLIETIRRIWASKRMLGLLEEPVPDTAAFGKTELLFAVTGWQNGDADAIRRRLPGTLSRTVRVAISAAAELYFDSGVPLE